MQIFVICTFFFFCKKKKKLVMGALKSAIVRKKQNKSEQLELTMDDLLGACRQQIVGQLELTGFSRRVVPEKCLQDVVLLASVKKTMETIIYRNKSAKVLSGQWGFEVFGVYVPEGTAILISGPDGVGKSTLAEVIAYECGKPMKVVTCAELLHLHHVRGASNTKDNVFSDLNTGAILVIENAELLFDEKTYNPAIGFILFQMRMHTTIFIFIIQGELHKGLLLNMSPVQKTLFKQFHFTIQLEHPNTKIRCELWQKLIPSQTPFEILDVTTSKSNQKQSTNPIDFQILAEKYPRFTHKDIKRVIVELLFFVVVEIFVVQFYSFLACGIACLRKEQNQRYLKMSDLLECAQNLEEKLENDEFSLRGLFGIYIFDETFPKLDFKIFYLKNNFIFSVPY
ncbi:hypothetical protein RFI_25992 [Reticulomyxa filosa]|uniref:AAA+ ATPase domain-containing protein n=1 Tax=Reticulomyxa filosa TaxID=46433 RepID=X6MC23_RETFI|nr:hypothetical protein RFI_25992 [Reticulomyxa filosa]|eukprot:ETO11384.1 hypothetical protein RFI_25992 [Reticulomyxa filosa]